MRKNAAEDRQLVLEGFRRKWQTERGQIWAIPSKTSQFGFWHLLMIGDSGDEKDVAMLLGKQRIQWIWTDPPYGVNVKGGFRGDPTRKGLTVSNDVLFQTSANKREAVRVVNRLAHRKGVTSEAFRIADDYLDIGSPFYICSAHFSEFMADIEKRWNVHQLLVWVKQKFVLGRFDYQPRHEIIAYGWKKGVRHFWRGGRKQNSVIELPMPARNEFHPTSKPVELVVRTLKNSALPGSVGYDPYAGSCSTILAAEEIGATCLAMELDSLYAAAALERLQRAGLQPRRHFIAERRTHIRRRFETGE